MPGVVNRPLFSLSWQGQVSDYVTAMAWAPNGRWLALASGAGDVQVLNVAQKQTFALESPAGQSIDCLQFSPDSQFLAAGGQQGQVKVWHLSDTLDAFPRLSLDHPRIWIEHLAWHPFHLELAFGLGRYVQVWEMTNQSLITTLPFETSSVLGLVWHPSGDSLGVGGHQRVKVWSAQDWDEEPIVRELSAASVTLAISADGQYLASGNLDNTLLVWRWDSPYPWMMRGFPGKVRHLAWSTTLLRAAPLLASASGERLVTWRKQADDEDGWHSKVLNHHQGKIAALAFQPGKSLLASAAEDGQLILWQKAKRVGQILQGVSQGFSTLTWHPSGQLLAAGGQQGEWQIWAQNIRGKGFQKMM